MEAKIRSLLVLALGLAVQLPPCAGSERYNERIAVSATTAPDYRRESGALEPQSYVFTPGHFLAGGTRDGKLETTTFDDLARILAPDLARQKYFPAKDADSADLVIVVHWGKTLVYEDPFGGTNPGALSTAASDYRAAIQAVGRADTGALNTALANQDTAADGQAAAINRNAELLGYRRTLEKERRKSAFGTAEEQTMSEELNEERYFVVLMAYDCQGLRKEHRSRLRWVTRLSIRSPGNNFTEALPILARAGSGVFGRELADLVHVQANPREGSVALGELKVLGVAEEPAVPKKK